MMKAETLRAVVLGGVVSLPSRAVECSFAPKTALHLITSSKGEVR